MQDCEMCKHGMLSGDKYPCNVCCDYELFAVQEPIFSGKEKQLESENQRLLFELEESRKEAKRYRELIDGNVRDTLLHSLNVDKGVTDLVIEHPIFYLFACSIAEMWVASGAKNFLETEMYHKDGGWFVVSVRKREGKLWAQMKKEYEAEIKKLKEIVDFVNKCGFKFKREEDGRPYLHSESQKMDYYVAREK